MSEEGIQMGLQAALQAMGEFADADVVVNDYAIYDQSSLGAPYVIIENAGEFDSQQDAETPNTTWHIPLVLVERFTGWQEARDNLRNRRQAIVDKINSGALRSAGGLEGVDVRRVRSGSEILEWYDPYIPEEVRKEALPAFLYQRIIVEVEEF
jgi:hypothetical protein